MQKGVSVELCFKNSEVGLGKLVLDGLKDMKRLRQGADNEK